MNQDNRNLVIFALIAVLVLFAWPAVMHKFVPAPPPTTANPPVTKIEGGKTEVLPNPGADPAIDTPKATQSRAAVLAATPRVRIDTPTLHGSINLKGARIDDLELTKYAQTVAKDSPPIRLLSPSGAPGAYFASFGWRGEGLVAPGPDTVWKASSAVLSPGHPVALEADNGHGQRFRIDLAVDDQYMFTVRQSVANAGQAAVPVATAVPLTPGPSTCATAATGWTSTRASGSSTLVVEYDHTRTSPWCCAGAPQRPSISAAVRPRQASETSRFAGAPV